MSAPRSASRAWTRGCVRYNDGVSDLKGKPLVVAAPARPGSGEKYLTPQGFTAIRDGIKRAAGGAGAAVVAGRLPPWLKARAPTGARVGRVRGLVREHRVAAVCEEAKCPRIGECWNAGTATHMLTGLVRIGACRSCSVHLG